MNTPLKIALTLAAIAVLTAILVWQSICCEVPPPDEAAVGQEGNSLVTETPSGLTLQEPESDADQSENAFVRTIELPELGNLIPGDNFVVPIPQEDVKYVGVVESVSLTEAGNTTIIAAFPFSGTDYRVVFTLGKVYTFGTLHTPKGRYQLQGKDGVAEIVSTTDINRGRFFFGPDFVVPEPPNPRKNRQKQLELENNNKEAGSV